MHTKLLAAFFASLSLFVVIPASAANPQVELKTNLGNITVELYPDKAPKTVENFLGYVKEGYYNGTIFHRVIPRFMIQGGGFDKSFKQKPARQPVQNEAANGLKNETGTVGHGPNIGSALGIVTILRQRRKQFLPELHSSYDYKGMGIRCSER